MNKSETVEIKKHGNTYEDITFCPECGSKHSIRIREGDYGHNTFIFNVHGPGKEYKCEECDCEYLICKTDKLMLRHFNGFVGVLFFAIGVILIITSTVLLAEFLSSLNEGVTRIPIIISSAVSVFAGIFFLYICDYSRF